MSRLDDYRIALRAADERVSAEELREILDSRDPEFASFIVDYGLGPLWHSRTERQDFRDSRLAAEAHFLAQQSAIQEIDAAFAKAKIEYVVIKGAANRVVLYENPAIRSCHDVDLIVHPRDRVSAGTALVALGYEAIPKVDGISHEMEFIRGAIGLDLHWRLLREGRLKANIAAEFLSRRCRVNDVWMLAPEDALFVLLVHPAFAKHLGSWDMGLHRVHDLVLWLRTQEFDWPFVVSKLRLNGVRTAAWATLRWLELLAGPNVPEKLHVMIGDLRPGAIRSTWLGLWIEQDLSNRTRESHWIRLLGFSFFLHDTSRDSLRSFRGRYRAFRRQNEDLAAFADLLA